MLLATAMRQCILVPVSMAGSMCTTNIRELYRVMRLHTVGPIGTLVPVDEELAGICIQQLPRAPAPNQPSRWVSILGHRRQVSCSRNES